MTATAVRILEEFKQLAPSEKREVLEAIAREGADASPLRPGPSAPRRTNRIRLDPVLASEIALSDAFTPEEA